MNRRGKIHTHKYTENKHKKNHFNVRQNHLFQYINEHCLRPQMKQISLIAARQQKVIT